MAYLLSAFGMLALSIILVLYTIRVETRARAKRDLEEKHQAAAEHRATESEPTTGQNEASEIRAARDEDLTRAGRLALGDLAAGIAHEINNPVAIMVEEAGWIEDLLEEEEFRPSTNLEELKRALRQIKTQGTRCKEITHNLLSYARKTSPKVEEVQLNDLIRDVVRSSEKKLRSGSVKIEAHLAESLCTVRVSPSEMQQVLLNLINNAIDAVEPTGRIGITSSVEGGDVLIDVADNGEGISRSNLDRIFDPFFTTKPVGKGTGLGLAICYGIMNKMGGEIRVSSTEGVGTTFRLRVPAEGPEGQNAKPPGPSKPLVPERDRTGPEDNVRVAKVPTVVLVVDDEVPLVEALCKRLRKRNLVALEAFGGQEALETLDRNENIDVVLLDVKMPGMDGIETMREITKAHPLVEVILLSGHTTVESAIEGMRLGAFDYLLKPCDVAQLLDQIEKAKARKSRQEQKIVEARIQEITLRRV